MNPSQRKTNLGLTFLTLLSFAVGFFTARIFTTITPDTVVVSGGIHFHHFWYGLAMVVVAGWLGLASYHPSGRRVYAVIFGFGGGLIGDEVGLLLTFGDYHSLLTYVFLVALVCAVALLTLLLRFRAEIQRDLAEVGKEEAATHFGLVVTCSAALPLAFGFLLPGFALALIGVALTVGGVILRGRRKP